MHNAAGLVHLYTGMGKGKTTAAVGLAARMSGCGGRVLFCQFLKGRATGELSSLETLGVVILRTDEIKKFTNQMNAEELEACTVQCKNCLAQAAQAMAGSEYDMVVLDEVVDAVTYGFLTMEELLSAIMQRNIHCEIVLTGHSLPQELTQVADYISEITCIKHPYEKGIMARRGVEY